MHFGAFQFAGIFVQASQLHARPFGSFLARHPGVAPKSHQTAYDRAVRLMRTSAAEMG
jgi:hypothetical protein